MAGHNPTKFNISLLSPLVILQIFQGQKTYHVKYSFVLY